MTKFVVQMLFELTQAWFHDHFPGDAVPVTDHTLSEEFFPNVQTELPMMQLNGISSCTVAGHQREEISPSSSTAPLEKTFRP